MNDGVIIEDGAIMDGMDDVYTAVSKIVGRQKAHYDLADDAHPFLDELTNTAVQRLQEGPNPSRVVVTRQPELEQNLDLILKRARSHALDAGRREVNFRDFEDVRDMIMGIWPWTRD